MKVSRFLPWIILIITLLWIGSKFLPQRAPTGNFDFAAFAKIPVLEGGRLKPLDTVARNSCWSFTAGNKSSCPTESP
jgi:hypothetical protein